MHSSFLSFEETNFHLFGKAYAYEDVRNLTLYWVKTSHSVNLLPIGSTESARILVKLCSGETLDADVGDSSVAASWIWSQADAIQALVQGYRELAVRTFSHRLNGYLDDHKRHGFIQYDSCKFLPPTMIIFKGKREFVARETQFFKQQGMIVMKKRKRTVWESIRDCFNPASFNTQTDSDVIFHILERGYHLKW